MASRLVLLTALSLLPLGCHYSQVPVKPDFASINVQTASFEPTMSVGTFSLPALPYAYDVSLPCFTSSSITVLLIMLTMMLITTATRPSSPASRPKSWSSTTASTTRPT